MNKPKAVRDAQVRGESDKLSAMGRKGASHRIQLLDARKADDQAKINERVAEIARTETVVDGNVLPPEPPPTEH